MYKKGIFIFRRDLRLSDNLGLIEFSKRVETIIPIFIFDPNQLFSTHASMSAIQFMCESLLDLNKQLHKKLKYYYGEPNLIIKRLLSIDKTIDCVGFNGDFSKYSIIRDKKIIKACKDYKVGVYINNNDLTLHPPNKTLKKNGEGYIVFNHFYKHSKKIKINKIIRFAFLNKIINYNTSFSYNKNINKFYKKNMKLITIGGRDNAKKILKDIKKFKNYTLNRDYLDYNTTHLSSYLKFGCVSIRECYWIFKKSLNISDLIKQLYWRSYYFNICIYVSNEYNFIDNRFNTIKWKNNSSEWKKMWNGRTGFLAIDACVCELNTTGFMHNRGRLITSNFSIKILRLNPFDVKWGGQIYFSKKLVDCCYANNVGNWHWVSTDTFDQSGRRFSKGLGGRIFNPHHFEKWDPDCYYIKKWLPHLKDIPNKHLLHWEKYCDDYKKIHPSPIVDFDMRKTEWLSMTANL